MTAGLVMNRNGQAFLSAFEALEKRGAPEACLMIVDGEPGLGKSAFMLWWTLETGSLYLRACKGWTPAWMMRDLLAALSGANGEAPAHSFEAMFKHARKALACKADEAMREGRSFALVIDEVDHIARKANLLETVRDLSDTLEIPIILVGMGRVRHHLVRFPQVASRVGQYVAFQPLNPGEAMVLAQHSLPVKVDDPLIAFLHKVTGGRMREIREGLRAIERFAGRNHLTRVTLQDMVGQTLLVNRYTGKPIKVTQASLTQAPLTQAPLTQESLA